MTPAQPPSQTLRERAQRLLDNNRAVVVIEALLKRLDEAALAAQEAVPLCEEGCHVADQLGPHRRCVKCGHEWYFPAKPDA